MTRYEIGFLTKCAEAGVDTGTAMTLLEKVAVVLNRLGKVMTRPLPRVGKAAPKVFRRSMVDPFKAGRSLARRSPEAVRASYQRGRDAYLRGFVPRNGGMPAVSRVQPARMRPVSELAGAKATAQGSVGAFQTPVRPVPPTPPVAVPPVHAQSTPAVPPPAAASRVTAPAAANAASASSPLPRPRVLSLDELAARGNAANAGATAGKTGRINASAASGAAAGNPAEARMGKLVRSPEGRVRPAAGTRPSGSRLAPATRDMTPGYSSDAALSPAYARLLNHGLFAGAAGFGGYALHDLLDSNNA